MIIRTNEYINSQREIYKVLLLYRYGYHNNFRVFFNTLLAIIGLFYILHLIVINNLGVGPAAGILAAIGCLLFFFEPFISTKSLLAITNNPTLLKKKFLEINDESFTVQVEDGTSRNFQVKNLKKVVKILNYLLFIIPPNQVIPVPLSAFSSLNDVENLKMMLSRSMPGHKIKF